MLKIGVVGALGKMGKEVVKAVLNAEDMQLVLAVDILGEGTDAGIAACSKECGVKIRTDFEKATEELQPDVVIDFTQPSTIYDHVSFYISKKNFLYTVCIYRIYFKEI